MWLWSFYDGLLLTSADDATRLLMAHAWGSQGIFPWHWTWPPFPMLADGLLVALGGDAIVCAAVIRAILMGAAGILLASFWGRSFPISWKPSVAVLSMALWLSFPINVRLALSGLSEPYLYLLLVIGMRAWQHATELPGEDGPGCADARRSWLVAAGLAFGLSVWCRYEGAVMALLFALWIVGRKVLRRSKLPAESAGLARESWLAPLLATALLPIAWLVLQLVGHGDPLYFVWATQAFVREEAASAYGTSRMPLSAGMQALFSELWSLPIAVLAAIGFLRLRRENRRVWLAVLAFLVLYAGMALVTIGGRFAYYLNLFSLLVIPLAAQGAAVVSDVAAHLLARSSRRFPTEIASRLAMTAIGFYAIVIVDLPLTMGATPGDWLAPESRRLFVRLRDELESERRVLIVLDPDITSSSTHPYDSFALQVAAPERVIVLPFAYPVVANLDATPGWVVYPPWSQAELRADVTRLVEWLRDQRFSRIIWQGAAVDGPVALALDRLEGLSIRPGAAGTESAAARASCAGVRGTRAVARCAHRGAPYAGS